MNYKQVQLQSQLAFLAKSSSFSNGARSGGGLYQGKSREFVLRKEYELENLFPAIRESISDYFQRHKIVWHDANAHVLSSQVCCVNFFEPFARAPDALRILLEKVLGPIAQMLEIEPDSDPGRYIAFEFIGANDYLNEGKSGKRTRGANYTSADAAVRYKTTDGIIAIALIEWKYTESYGPPLALDTRNVERLRRYQDISFHPKGPLRSDCGVNLVAFFTEPVYQLLRQQILAFQITAARELQSQFTRTVYISPRANLALKRIHIDVLNRFGRDVTTAWSALLHSPQHFIPYATEDLFADSLDSVKVATELTDWRSYMADRYGFG
jgi:hypothetical protein